MTWRMLLLLQLALLTHILPGSSAFISLPQQPAPISRAKTSLGWKIKVSTKRAPLFMATDDNEFSSSSSSSSSSGTWRLTNDFPHFLNQCAIQSFVFLLRNLRDPQTIRWVDNFTAPVFDDSRKNTNKRLTGTTEATMAISSSENVTNPDGQQSYSKLLTYHGLGIMNTTKFPTWDTYFAELLELPVETFWVQSFSSHHRDYELEVNPASLCSRIVSVRGQIATEFENDLGVLANLGQHTMDAYWYHMDYQRDDGDENNDENEDSDIGNNRDYSSSSNHGKATMSSGDSSQRILAQPNLVFLEYSLDELSDEGLKPSLLRKGNFDLLTLLATQESIHRLLNNNKKAKLIFLENFYTNRIFSHFTGIQRYGRADDFLEELLFSTGRIDTPEGETIMVDPVQLTERILKERTQVALEWQAMCRDIPNAHMQIKRLQLDRMMQGYNTNENQEEESFL